ncbi:LOW QUALITY PROTEIN: uncharacterized protein LOC119614904 [Lucilia sericata]|uniref:LOW QUALITY PROTEIN: uncharacterized protein LOC119614904 n=1 Tax=Lucilia sericata TaxID=13632 RepID=UPI0018A850B2|nr:LOW QUALITY PROTEIN: uncharacterized protein LOC119614904 [Lucilia sericata]
MLLTKTQIYKLLFITLALCCLINSGNARKLPKTHTNVNGTDVATSAKVDKTEVSTTETTAVAAAEAIKETESKSSEEEEDGDEEDDSDTADKADNEDNDEDDDDDEDETAEKNALQPAADSSLSVWGIVRGFWNWIREDISESLFGDDGKTTAAVGEGRTFGKIRRLQMALIPIVFKFGVLSAMVAFLVAIGMKTLFLVKVLVVMNLLALLGKFFTLKSHFGHVEHVAASSCPHWNWTPYASNGWQSSAPVEHHSNKEIHLHIHGGQGQPQVSGYSYGSSAAAAAPTHGWERRNDPYSAYETMALQGQQNELVPNELTSSPNDQQFGNFPANHRML